MGSALAEPSGSRKYGVSTRRPQRELGLESNETSCRERGTPHRVLTQENAGTSKPGFLETWRPIPAPSC